MCPLYLSELIPQTTNERHSYTLRTRENITPFRCNRQYFSRSFFPSTVRDWNNLPLKIRQSPTFAMFCKSINIFFPQPVKNSWYGQGDRFLDIHHARIRIGCSQLRSQLYHNLHVVDSPACPCGDMNESPTHYFFHCPLFNVVQ